MVTLVIGYIAVRQFPLKFGRYLNLLDKVINELDIRMLGVQKCRLGGILNKKKDYLNDRMSIALLSYLIRLDLIE